MAEAGDLQRVKNSPEGSRNLRNGAMTVPLPEDRLTKLIAEDELVNELRYEMERARRYGWDLGLFFVEPDVPADVGQDMAYPVLRRLAAVCSTLMRSVDKGIRFQSGVLYILPETPLGGVETASDKVKKMFAEVDFEHPVTGEPFKCGMRRTIKVFAGKREKDAATDEPAIRLILRELKDSLKA